MQDMTGFNADAVITLGSDVNNLCQEVCQEIYSCLTNEVITPMSECLYTQEGVDYFESFCTHVNNQAPHIYECFQSFNNGLQKSVSAWAYQTKNPEPSVPAVSEATIGLSAGVMKNNLAGTVGIREDAALAVKNKLPGVQTDLLARLKMKGGAIVAAAAFVGRNQAEAIEDMMVRVTGVVGDMFRFLTEDTNGQSLATAIETCTNNYIANAEAVEQAFRNQG